MFGLGGHLGSSVSALVDGQLADAEAARAWQHVAGCASCQSRVERETWTKRQVTRSRGDQPSASLLGSLYELREGTAVAAPDVAARAAWTEVERLESQGRTRRRVGLAAAGAGSLSAAVLGFSALGGAPLGIGGAPARPPAASVSDGTATPSRTPSPSGTPSRPRTARGDGDGGWLVGLLQPGAGLQPVGVLPLR